MAFADTQIRKLRSKLKPAHIKSREADGATNLLERAVGSNRDSARPGSTSAPC